MIVWYDLRFLRTIIDDDQIVPGGVYERRTHRGWTRGIIISVANNEVCVLLAEEQKHFVNINGDSFIDPGYVFAPYVPLQVSPSIIKMSVKIK